jgi:hypothetical protein
MTSEHERIVEELAIHLTRPGGWNLWPADARRISWDVTVFLLHQGWLTPQEADNLRKELAVARVREQEALDTLTELEPVRERSDVATQQAAERLYDALMTFAEVRGIVKGGSDERD